MEIQDIWKFSCQYLYAKRVATWQTSWQSFLQSFFFSQIRRPKMSKGVRNLHKDSRALSVHQAEPLKTSCAPNPQGATSILWLQLQWPNLANQPSQIWFLSWETGKAFTTVFAGWLLIVTSFPNIMRVPPPLTAALVRVLIMHKPGRMNLPDFFTSWVPISVNVFKTLLMSAFFISVALANSPKSAPLVMTFWAFVAFIATFFAFIADFIGAMTGRQVEELSNANSLSQIACMFTNHDIFNHCRSGVYKDILEFIPKQGCFDSFSCQYLYAKRVATWQTSWQSFLQSFFFSQIRRPKMSKGVRNLHKDSRALSVHQAEPLKTSCAPNPQGATSILWLQLQWPNLANQPSQIWFLSWETGKAFTTVFAGWLLIVTSFPNIMRVPPPLTAALVRVLIMHKPGRMNLPDFFTSWVPISVNVFKTLLMSAFFISVALANSPKSAPLVMTFWAFVAFIATFFAFIADFIGAMTGRQVEELSNANSLSQIACMFTNHDIFNHCRSGVYKDILEFIPKQGCFDSFSCQYLYAKRVATWQTSWQSFLQSFFSRKSDDPKCPKE